MSDRWAVALAAATAIGAAAARGPSPLAGAIVVAIALVARRPWLLCLGAALLASGLAARSWAGLDGAVPGPFDRVVTLVGDPEVVGAAVRVDVSAGGRRYEAWATGAARTIVSDLLAGDRVGMRGEVRPAPAGGLPPWVARRHVAARLGIDGAGPVHDSSPVNRLANGLRRTLAAGAQDLAPAQQALLAGLVVGDDRAQSPVVSDEFEAAGLVHLLAVSGQNVAFVLAVAAPALSRMGLRSRLAATVTLLGFFGLVTRFEPSVLRATAMAAVATLATTVGREASSVRLLALAVTGVLLVDPLLVGSVGFQLSVGASLGIVLLSGPLARRLPLPGWLARPLSVTLAAQVGVAPVLVPVFGGVPVASIPANLLAVPAAGPVMMWGLTGGLLAGIAAHVPGGGVGAAIASALHVPTRLLLAWIAGVAHRFGTAPLGEFGAPHLAVVAGAVVVVACCRRRPVNGPWRPRVAAAAVAAGVVGVVVPIVVAVLPAPPPLAERVAGLDVWRRGPAVVVVIAAPAPPSVVLEGLRRRGIEHVDVVVVTSAVTAQVEVAAALQERFVPPMVMVPPGASVPGATPVEGEVAVAVGGAAGLEVAVAAADGIVTATVVPAGGGLAGALESGP